MPCRMMSSRPIQILAMVDPATAACNCRRTTSASGSSGIAILRGQGKRIGKSEHSSLSSPKKELDPRIKDVGDGSRVFSFSWSIKRKTLDSRFRGNDSLGLFFISTTAMVGADPDSVNEVVKHVRRPDGGCVNPLRLLYC